MLPIGDLGRQPSRNITIGGWRRFYADSGSDGFPVLFLHGIPSHHVLWREVTTHLQGNFRSIAPDLTGFGFSDLPSRADLSPAGQAADLLAFLDLLRIDRFGIVAHDFGALVACEILNQARGRVTHLAITNTSLGLGDWAGTWLNPLRLFQIPYVGELAMSLSRRFMLKWAYSIYVADRSKLNDDLMDALWEPFERDFSQTLLRLLRSHRPHRADADRWRGALQLYSAPALIVWGRLDPTFPSDRADDIAALLPQASLINLKHSNHFVPIDRPRVLARLINRLLAETASS